MKMIYNTSMRVVCSLWVVCTFLVCLNCSPSHTPEASKAEKNPSPIKSIEFSYPSGKTTNITLSEAIKIARAGLIKKTNDPSWGKETVGIKADDNNTRWNDEVYRNPRIWLSPNIQEMHLGGKNYWAIYFQLKVFPPIPGAFNGFVFIDRTNGKILGFSLGH
ncbi:MAG: hypothetical protein PHE84_04820 [bacterium]|nr:hypothetical protein [bacterium]